MRVLMLDKNFLVDRRTALMAESLSKQGHEVKLINVETPAAFVDTTERRRRLPKPKSHLSVMQLPADRESDYLINPDAVGDPPPHVSESLGSVYFDRRRRRAIFNQRLASRTGARQKLTPELLKLVMQYPECAAELISGHPKLTSLQRLAALPLWAASLPLRIFSRDGGSNSDVVQTVKGVRSLDPWERSAIRYATEYWKPDIVVPNDAITLLAGAEIKNRLNIPMVYDEHELYSYQPGLDYGLAKSLFVEELKLLKYVDWVILPNTQSYYIMERDMGVLNKVICTNAAEPPPGFDVRKRYDWIRDEVAIPENHKIILFQGGINTGRRIDYLVKGLAAARVRNVHLVFLTFGQEIPEFKALAAMLGIADRVHFLDLVPWDEVVYWAASADVGFLPYQATDQNTAASSPNKLYEFITAGTPIIGSSDLSNVRRIVESEGFGVLRPFRKVQDYADAIDEMFDPALGGPERFRPRLIERAAAYSWATEVKPSVKLFEQLLKGEVPEPALPSERVLQHVPPKRKLK
jgi:glycosyltransferase involved in cell wall biosynthesis